MPVTPGSYGASKVFSDAIQKGRSDGFNGNGNLHRGNSDREYAPLKDSQIEYRPEYSPAEANVGIGISKTPEQQAAFDEAIRKAQEARKQQLENLPRTRFDATGTPIYSQDAPQTNPEKTPTVKALALDPEDAERPEGISDEGWARYKANKKKQKPTPKPATDDKGVDNVMQKILNGELKE